MSDRYSLILATDLDGTFFGGSPDQRTQFYDYLKQHRQNLLLIFVTGRSLELIDNEREAGDFPHPDYVIGDVGTTVVNWKTRQPLAEVQDWIDRVWNDGGDRVKELLADEPGLKLQPIVPQYRVSYYYDPKKLQPETLAKIEAAGFDCITSADEFLDVMPPGVAKGPTLLRTIDALQLNSDDVICAGDTLNDRSLFETGLKGIAVGNAEPKLVERIQTLDNVYHSTAPGAAGIWEGLEHYGKQF